MAKAEPTDNDAPGTPEASPRRSSRIAVLAKKSPKALKPVQTPQRVEKQTVKKTPVKKKVIEAEVEKKTPVKKTPVKKVPEKKAPVKKAAATKKVAIKEIPNTTQMKEDQSKEADEDTEEKPVAKIRINLKTARDKDPEPAMAEKRRNAKRKAAEELDSEESGSDEAPDDVLEEALRPLTDEERAEWPGWIELESEPSFFSIILRDLGVPDVKVQEIFSLDQQSLDTLPTPVYGLIFLYQYDGTEEAEDNEDDYDHVWFANQTVENSCATVALLNIIMNQDLQFGDQLRDFKTATQDLTPALRGFELGRNQFIRSVHNSFARRMDILDSDLILENKSTSRKGPKKAKKSVSNRKPAKKPKKPTRQASYAFHFTAYVSAGDAVWELDGLKNHPVKIGDIVDEEDFTSVVGPYIEARMLQYHEDQIVFNLLALCKSPLSTIANTITDTLASIVSLDETAPFKDADYVGLVSEEDQMALTETELAQFGLTQDDIDTHDISEERQTKIETRSNNAASAFLLRREMVNDARTAMGEYRAEVMSSEDDVRRVENRKKDYGLAIHTWVSKLAEKGVLEELIAQSR